MDNRAESARAIYIKLTSAMNAVEGQHPTIAGLSLTCHTGEFLTSLTPEELAHLQTSIAYRTMANVLSK